MDGWICVTVQLSTTDGDIALLFAFKICFAAQVSHQSRKSREKESVL